MPNRRATLSLPVIGRVAGTRGDLQSLFLETVSDADQGSYVAVPGRGGSLIRSLVPGLWSSSPRILGVGEREAVLLAASFGHLKVKRQLWRGPKESVRLRRYLGDRIIRMTFPGRRKVQIDGKESCRAVLDAFGWGPR